MLYPKYHHLPNEPFSSGFAITPANSNLAVPARGLYVGVSGDLVVILTGDTAAITIKSAAVGYHPLCVQQVQTGTTATNIVGLY